MRTEIPITEAIRRIEVLVHAAELTLGQTLHKPCLASHDPLKSVCDRFVLPDAATGDKPCFPGGLVVAPTNQDRPRRISDHEVYRNERRALDDSSKVGIRHEHVEIASGLVMLAKPF